MMFPHRVVDSYEDWNCNHWFTRRGTDLLHCDEYWCSGLAGDWVLHAYIDSTTGISVGPCLLLLEWHSCYSAGSKSSHLLAEAFKWVVTTFCSQGIHHVWFCCLWLVALWLKVLCKQCKKIYRLPWLGWWQCNKDTFKITNSILHHSIALLLMALTPHTQLHYDKLVITFVSFHLCHVLVKRCLLL